MRLKSVRVRYVWERGRRLLFEDSLIYREMLAQEDQAKAGGGQ